MQWGLMGKLDHLYFGTRWVVTESFMNEAEYAL